MVSRNLIDNLSLFKDVIEHSSEEIFLIRPDRTIVFANKAAAFNLGYSLQEILSLSMSEFDSYLSLHSGDNDDLLSRLKQNESFTFDTIHQSKNGTRIFKRVKAAYLSNETGEYICLYAHDITGKMRTALDILRREERFRNVFEQSSDGIFITGIDGSIIEWNEKIEQLTGIPKIDAVDKNIHDVYTSMISGNTDNERLGQIQKYNEILSQVQKGIQVQNTFETSIQSLDGSLYQVQHIVFPVTSLQEGSFLLGNIIRDITDRIKLEDERIRTQKLESLGILAGGIAHDFRNILSAILGNVTLAGMALDHSSPQHKYLSSAETAVLRAKDLTSRLLTFSKGGEPIKNTISVNESVEESAHLILTGSNVHCTLELDDSMPDILADRVQIGQVIQNIIINAMQAMPDGGTLIINTSHVLLDSGQVLLLDTGKYAMISIADTGSGIPKEHLEKIYDPYFTTKPEGTGLGLSVVYSIIRKHGGNITVTSTPGKGTIFTLYLPCSDPEREIYEKGDPDPSSAPFTGSGHILVIDDEDIVRSVIKNLLKSIGYSAESTSTVEEGLELYKTRITENARFDAIIMDLTIKGGISGRKGIQLFKELHPDVKVIVASGYSNDPVLSRFEEYGFFDALVKPIELRELSRIMKRAVR
jgi:two-component system, cell cycle sensor histidine kinase and response regulator CckA